MIRDHAFERLVEQWGEESKRKERRTDEALTGQTIRTVERDHMGAITAIVLSDGWTLRPRADDSDVWIEANED